VAVQPYARAVSVLLGVALLAACSAGDDDNTATATSTTASVAESASTADSRADDWALYGHDYANTRRNVDETKITRATVQRLDKQWSRDDLVAVTGTPTVADGVAYLGDWTGAVHALDAETGDEVWSTQLGGMFVGAPSVVDDAVYASSGSNLFRLDRDSGEVVWTAKTNDHPLSQINASPVVVDGLVLQGVASFEVVLPQDEYTFRGSIGAYDADTGDEVWRFYTTDNDAKGGAGVGIWSTPAVDVERGLLYVGTGNAYAEPTGPLADSIIALDYKTGALEWKRQFTHPDVFSAGNPGGKDADVGASPNLWTSNGRELVGAGDKGGVYHALDRDTGEIVWERRLTAGSVFGGEIGSGAFVDGKLVVVSNVGDAETNTPKDVSHVFALDPATGDELWKSKEFPQLMFAPVGAVPGLAFVGTTAGTLVALDTRDGKQLWSYDAPAKTGCGPSIVDGNVLWGYGFTFGPGSGTGGVISFRLSS
jgi:polyvinyl alcohol dehydrogenase (cytochrome)